MQDPRLHPRRSIQSPSKCDQTGLARRKPSQLLSIENELTVKNGIIFKGDRVLSPFHQRDEQEIRLHSIHVGIQSCKRRAMKAFYIRFKH